MAWWEDPVIWMLPTGLYLAALQGLRLGDWFPCWMHHGYAGRTHRRPPCWRPPCPLRRQQSLRGWLACSSTSDSAVQRVFPCRNGLNDAVHAFCCSACVPLLKWPEWCGPCLSLFSVCSIAEMAWMMRSVPFAVQRVFHCLNDAVRAFAEWCWMMQSVPFAVQRVFHCRNGLNDAVRAFCCSACVPLLKWPEWCGPCLSLFSVCSIAEMAWMMRSVPFAVQRVFHCWNGLNDAVRAFRCSACVPLLKWPEWRGPCLSLFSVCAVHCCSACVPLPKWPVWCGPCLSLFSVCSIAEMAWMMRYVPSDIWSVLPRASPLSPPVPVGYLLFLGVWVRCWGSRFGWNITEGWTGRECDGPDPLPVSQPASFLSTASPMSVLSKWLRVR